MPRVHPHRRAARGARESCARLAAAFPRVGAVCRGAPRGGGRGTLRAAARELRRLARASGGATTRAARRRGLDRRAPGVAERRARGARPRRAARCPRCIAPRRPTRHARARFSKSSSRDRRTPSSLPRRTRASARLCLRGTPCTTSARSSLRAATISDRSRPPSSPRLTRPSLSASSASNGRRAQRLYRRGARPALSFTRRAALHTQSIRRAAGRGRGAGRPGAAAPSSPTGTCRRRAP